LAQTIAEHSTSAGLIEIGAAFRQFESVRKPVVEALQEAASSSLLMLEKIHEDWHLDPLPFAFKMMTRSGRMTIEKLRKRDPDFVAAYESWLEKEVGSG
jgi:anthraniloyl-CoA monooxygenase